MIIRVYNGFGSSSYGTPILIKELQRYLPHSTVAGIGEKEICSSEQWKKETGTLVIAGKSVGEFKTALQERALTEISNGVYEGQFDFIGICAGAVLACHKIKYRMQPVTSQPRTIETKGLSFFNIYATGPARQINPLPFSGNSENINLITLRSSIGGSPYTSFHWGGPAFIPLSPIKEPQGRALSFLKDTNLPMSLQIQHGQGRVSICSHHPEITKENMDTWIRPHCMTPSEQKRIEALAEQLDGTALQHFLTGSGLLPRAEIKKEATPAAPSLNLAALF